MLSALLSLLFKNLLFLSPSPTEISFPLHSSHLPLNATSTLLGVKRERSPEQTNCPARPETGPESGGPDCGSDFLWPFQAGFPTRSPLGLPLRSVSGEAWQLTMVLIQRPHNCFQMLFS